MLMSWWCKNKNKQKSNLGKNPRHYSGGAELCRPPCLKKMGWGQGGANCRHLGPPDSSRSRPCSFCRRGWGAWDGGRRGTYLELRSSDSRRGVKVFIARLFTTLPFFLLSRIFLVPVGVPSTAFSALTARAQRKFHAFSSLWSNECSIFHGKNVDIGFLIVQWPEERFSSVATI